MGEQVEKIIGLSKGAKIGILIGTVVLIVGVFWFAVYAPIGEEMAQLAKAMEGPQGLRAKIAEQQAIVKNLKRFEEEVALLDGELTKALQELPDKKEIYLLLSKISDRATGAGLNIRLFKPQPEMKKDFYAEVPVAIEVSGSFHQVATFFDEVGHLERIVNIDKISMVEPQLLEDAMNLKTTMTATAFRFLEESERPKQDDEKGGKKRRRGRAAKEAKGE